MKIKWFIKQFGNEWLTHCPYCGHMKRHSEKPFEIWHCERCNAVVNEDTYKQLDKLVRVLSKEFESYLKGVK